MNVVVPTGNFGNILASFYAKQIEFRSENSSVLPIRTKYCLISSGPVLMTGEESFMLQLLRPWIF